jgi:hypothetical protein
MICFSCCVFGLIPIIVVFLLMKIKFILLIKNLDSKRKEVKEIWVQKIDII